AARPDAADGRRTETSAVQAGIILDVLPARTASEIRVLSDNIMFDTANLAKAIFGRLSLDSLPLHEPILVGTFAVVAIGGLALCAAVTYFRLWAYLWREWFTTVDHKRIGIMYMVLGIVMLLRGFADALMMRMQQAMAFNG